MALGKIKRMFNNMARVKTLNSGILVDMVTGTGYEFSRPAITGNVTKWNVKEHDIVSFTIVNGAATAVALYVGHIDGRVVELV